MHTIFYIQTLSPNKIVSATLVLLPFQSFSFLRYNLDSSEVGSVLPCQGGPPGKNMLGFLGFLLENIWKIHFSTLMCTEFKAYRGGDCKAPVDLLVTALQ